MPSKDAEKNRQSAKRRMAKFRERQKGVTRRNEKTEGVTDLPVGVTPMTELPPPRPMNPDLLRANRNSKKWRHLVEGD